MKIYAGDIIKQVYALVGLGQLIHISQYASISIYYLMYIYLMLVHILCIHLSAVTTPTQRESKFCSGWRFQQVPLMLSCFLLWFSCSYIHCIGFSNMHFYGICNMFSLSCWCHSCLSLQNNKVKSCLEMENKLYLKGMFCKYTYLHTNTV